MFFALKMFRSIACIGWSFFFVKMKLFCCVYLPFHKHELLCKPYYFIHANEMLIVCLWLISKLHKHRLLIGIEACRCVWIHQNLRRIQCWFLMKQWFIHFVLHISLSRLQFNRNYSQMRFKKNQINFLLLKWTWYVFSTWITKSNENGQFKMLNLGKKCLKVKNSSWNQIRYRPVHWLFVPKFDACAVVDARINTFMLFQIILEIICSFLTWNEHPIN